MNLTRGWVGISAKLFCKRSQVTSMPSGIVLKGERRSFFSVNLQSILRKKNLALMGWVGMLFSH